MIHVVLVDDHKLFRDGLKLILSGQKDISVVGEFGNGSAFLEALPELKPDVVLMDIELPDLDGIETTRQAVLRYPDIRILTLSSHGEESYYQKMVGAGARGFLIKECSSNELVEAIGKVNTGDNYFSQELLRRIIYKLGSGGLPAAIPASPIPELSSRESEVLLLICEGKTNAEIADALFLSQRTVEGHRANLLKKTQSRNTTALIMFALKSGLFKG